MGIPMNDDELQAEMAKYRWYHTIPLTDAISTPGTDRIGRFPPVIRQMDKLDFRGKRVLDIGCRDGHLSFMAEKRGAKRVYAIDNCISRGAVELLIPYLDSKVEMAEVGLFDLTPAGGQFDIILFVGVLYHLRYPFWALKVLAELMPDGGSMIIETGILADDNERAMLFCPSDEETPYKDGTSVTFFNMKGLTDALRTVGLRTEAVDYINSTEAEITDGRIIRGTVLCERDSSLDNELDDYWMGKQHGRLSS